MAGHAGKQLFDVVTGGMYTDPLMALREYVQNAVDSIDGAIASGLLSTGEGTVEVNVDGRTRTVSVEDNGAGMDAESASDILLSVGVSTKDQAENRGFRGIGRLGGLGYCDEVVFRTRASGRSKVLEVSWNAADAQDALSDPHATSPRGRAWRRRLGAMAHPCSRNSRPLLQSGDEKREAFPSRQSHGCARRPTGIWERSRLFRLTRMSSRSPRRLRSTFMDSRGTRDTTSVSTERCCPNPMETNSRFREAPSTTSEASTASKSLRPEGNRIAKGWCAQTSLRSALPPRARMRGIRLRQGNFQVGDEYVLAQSYAERRFATWHIGEVHLSPDLRLNARRDGFEQGAAHERFLEYAALLGKHLSRQCWVSSKKRSEMSTNQRLLTELERFSSAEFFIDADHFETESHSANRALERLESAVASGEDNADLGTRVAEIRRKLNNGGRQRDYLSDVLDRDRLESLNAGEVLLGVCRSLHKAQQRGLPLHQAAREVVRSVYTTQ